MSTTDARSLTYNPTKSCSPVVNARRALSGAMRRTPARSLDSRRLAASSIQRVMSVSAGPPFGGLYLNPPSSGGLCDGVMTIPSASPDVLPRL
jgi:hypothetical protein